MGSCAPSPTPSSMVPMLQLQGPGTLWTHLSLAAPPGGMPVTWRDEWLLWWDSLPDFQESENKSSLSKNSR